MHLLCVWASWLQLLEQVEAAKVARAAELKALAEEEKRSVAQSPKTRGTNQTKTQMDAWVACCLQG